MRILLCFFILSSSIFAVSLPSGMTNQQVRETVRVVGFGSVTRAMRDAESYPSWPGIKVGLEAVVVPTGDLQNFGLGNGSISDFFLLPRLYLSKGLFYDVDLIFSALPSGIINTLAVYGGILKWTFMSERDNLTGSVAAFVGYTHLKGLAGYTGDDWEAGLIASRDLVRIKPYLGISLLLADGGVSTALVPQFRARELAFHIFLGLEWELLANISAQVELFNLSPAASISFAHKF